MNCTGGKVALVATTSLPGRTTAGGVTTGAVGYLAPWACATAAGVASAARAKKRETRRRPEILIGVPPEGRGMTAQCVQPGRTTTALARQRASLNYHESADKV